MAQRLSNVVLNGALACLAGAFALTACTPSAEFLEARPPGSERAIADLGPVPSGAAQVCVVRPETLASQVSMMVHDNGHLVGATRGTTFFCYLASPGDHQITSIDDDTGPTFFHAQVGARYWLHQEVVELGGHPHAHLDWVDETTALELLESCTARVRVSVPGHDDEPGAQRIAPVATKPGPAAP